MVDIQESLQSKSQNVCNQLVISSSMYLTFTTQFCSEYNIEDVMLSSTLNVDDVHLYLCTLVGDCGNLYPYTVTDDRVGRNKKRKDNVKEFFPTRLYWEI
jgi:hypothetical protein